MVLPFDYKREIAKYGKYFNNFLKNFPLIQGLKS